MTDNKETVAPAVGTVDVEGLVDLALHMANRADEIALSGFAAGAREETKADGTPVTRIDREVETVLRDTIEREHSEAGVLGEEYGEESGVGRWVIDPIDGTRQFLDGDPRFAVLISYELGGEPVLGVVSAPALDARWWAGEGLGALFCHLGVVRAARVSGTRRMAKAQGMLLGGFDQESVARRPRLSRRSVSWEAVRVATGEYDFALTTGYRWDVSPLPVIVSEARGFGQLIEDEDGVNRLAVSNRHLADEVSALINQA